jgi:hypothetical protein
VIDEAVRLLHDRLAYFDIKLGLGNPRKQSVRSLLSRRYEPARLSPEIALGVHQQARPDACSPV